MGLPMADVRLPIGSASLSTLDSLLSTDSSQQGQGGEEIEQAVTHGRSS
jgi:hypothetical protein